MKVAVDISLYPLDADFVPPIKDVIARFNEHEGLEVWTNAMSTQLVGEFDDVMDALRKEIGVTFEQLPKAVFAIKILNNPMLGKA
ncbi:MAG: thiamine-binding protein [Gammaproteobacteria bacterium]|nr:thiamine-binding protein [Gammaproteobacteria bacterium]